MLEATGRGEAEAPGRDPALRAPGRCGIVLRAAERGSCQTSSCEGTCSVCYRNNQRVWRTRAGQGSVRRQSAECLDGPARGDRVGPAEGWAGSTGEGRRGSGREGPSPFFRSSEAVSGVITETQVRLFPRKLLTRGHTRDRRAGGDCGGRKGHGAETASWAGQSKACCRSSR